jgi:hypothetical protein
MNTLQKIKKETSQEKTSALLKRIAENMTGEKIHVGILLYRLRRRSFGGLFFFLALMSLIPGISIFSGILMIILSVQLSIGLRAPLLPRFISEYSLNVDYLKIILNRTAKKIETVERYIKPRILPLTQTPFTIIFGVLIFCLSAVVMVPLPFTNLVPAIAISIIALGFLERDGLIVLVGTAISILAISLGWGIIYLTAKGLENIF